MTKSGPNRLKTFHCKIQRSKQKKFKKAENMRGFGGRSRPPMGSRGNAPGGGQGATPPAAEEFLRFKR